MTVTREDRKTLTSVAEQMAVEMSDEQLLKEIGLRARTFALYPASAACVERSIPEAEALERAWDDLAEFGNWIFRRLHRQLQSVLPTSRGDADSRRLRRTFNLPELASASEIVSVLTMTLAVAPGIASVATALVLKRASNPGWEETYARPSRPLAEAH